MADPRDKSLISRIGIREDSDVPRRQPANDDTKRLWLITSRPDTARLAAQRYDEYEMSPAHATLRADSGLVCRFLQQALYGSLTASDRHTNLSWPLHYWSDKPTLAHLFACRGNWSRSIVQWLQNCALLFRLAGTLTPWTISLRWILCFLSCKLICLTEDPNYAVAPSTVEPLNFRSALRSVFQTIVPLVNIFHVLNVIHIKA